MHFRSIIPIVLAVWTFGVPFVAAEYSIDKISAQTYLMSWIAFQVSTQLRSEHFLLCNFLKLEFQESTKHCPLCDCYLRRLIEDLKPN